MGKTNLSKLHKLSQARSKKPTTHNTCTNCGDKGYNTVYQGMTVYSDFHGDKYYADLPQARVKICSHCARGSDLTLYFDIKSGREALI